MSASTAYCFRLDIFCVWLARSLLFKDLFQNLSVSSELYGDRSLGKNHITIRQSLSPDGNTRLTYCEGTLEITLPLEIHEFSA